MHVEHLAFTQQLATDRFRGGVVVVLAHVREDRLAVLGWRVHEREVADAGERQLQGARDRRGGEREHVDVGAHVLDALLVLHAEALLLVDDEQAELRHLHVVGEQPVGADHHVDRAGFEVAGDARLLLGRQEAREHLHPHRVVGEPLAERLAVLAREQRGRDEHHHLLAVLHRLERGAHRDLGLAVADVAAHEAVHRDRPLHVALHLFDGAQLVGRLLVGERLLHLVLPGRVGREGVTGRGEPLPVEHDQLLGDLLHRAADPRPLLLEVGAAHAVERRRLAARVLAHQPDLIGGHVDHAVAELQREVVALDARHGERLHLDVAADTVHVVHDVVARLERVVVVGAAARAARASVHAATAGEVGFGDERELRRRQHHPAADGRDDELDDAVDALRREHIVQTLQRAGALRREHDAIPLTHERAQATRQRVGVTDDGVERGGRDPRRVGSFGRLQQRHRAGLRVREQPVEVEREAREVFVGGRVPGDRERARERRLVVEQLLGTVAHALRFDEQGERAVGEEVEQEVLALGQPRQPRLHAVEHLAVGEALPLLAAPPLRAQQLGGALADGRGGEQLTGREDPRLVDVVGGALVGDRERRQPVDLVTPEVDADRVVVGGRVHVDDRAADGDLAPRLHLVLPPVAAGDQRLDQLVAVDPPARPDDDRLDLLDVGPEPLHQRPDRRHHHRGRVLGMAEPPEHAEAPAHGLERRRHPLERQRLPCREQLDLAERGRAGADELRRGRGRAARPRPRWAPRRRAAGGW